MSVRPESSILGCVTTLKKGNEGYIQSAKLLNMDGYTGGRVDQYPRCNCSCLYGGECTTSHGPLPIVSHVKVAKHAILATVHAHGGNPYPVLEGLATDRNGAEGGRNGLFRNTIFRPQDSRAHRDPLLWCEESETIYDFTAEI